MLEQKRPKAILLDDNDLILQTASLILEKQGWDVTCEEVSKEALSTLEKAQEGPYALFVTNYRLPRMEGDDILEKVKQISPLTQRILMVSDNEPDILINAINRAVVDACITAPFKEEDLVEQSRASFRHFKREVKRHRLKRVTRHQNQELFKAAQKLKKKNKAFQNEIDNKKKQGLKLKSRQRDLEKKNKATTELSIDSYIEQKKISLSPEFLIKEFNHLYRSIHAIFNIFTQKSDMEPFELNPAVLFKNLPTQPEARENAVDEENPSIAESRNSQSGKEDTTEDETDHTESGIKTDLPDEIIRYVMAKELSALSAPGKADHKEDHHENIKVTHPLDKYLEIIVSNSQTRAVIRQRSVYHPDLAPAVDEIRKWLSDKLITYGIIDDQAIETWLLQASEKKIVIARGIDPVVGRPGIVTYHFKSGFSNPGKVREDGSIDFRDRGDIPFVKKGDLLAGMQQAQQGKAGISISSVALPVEEVEEAVMVPGTGVRISDDGMSIYADIDGQPHVDAMGTVCVSPDLTIQGDVDFQTGNINFNGNIIVKGMVKEGFFVKGINLTVQEIEGGKIELSGDLNVSAGIMEADVQVQGNICAKFVNSSTLKGLGDIHVTREIIDSNIMVSGLCQNTSGHIMASRICAKRGIEAGKIGTSTSNPSILEVGTDAVIKLKTDEIDEKIEASVNQTALLKNEIKKLEAEDQDLYEKISEKAHIQDRTQIEIKSLKERLPEIEKSNDMVRLTRATDQIKSLTKRAGQAESELNAIFETQDQIAGRINGFKDQITILEKKNKSLVLEKQALIKFSRKTDPVPCVSVAKTITQDTTVKGIHCATCLREDRSRCRITEQKPESEGVDYYEMVFSEL